MTLDNIKEEIEKASKIVILTHESPDGDAVGSSLAMYNALKQLNKNVDLIIPEYPETFSFLSGSENIKKETDIQHYDVAISLDATDIKRLNGFANYFENAKVTINIDHHGSNKMFADYNFVNPDAPACCQILILVLEFLGVNITKEIGTCLLAGIITDTGGFKYSGTSKETFEFTSWLLSIGVNVADVYRRVLEIRTKGNFALTKLVIDRLEFLEDGKIAFTYITKEDEKNVNAKNGDHDGLVDIGRTVEGVEISILLREADGFFKGSLRSNEYVNVSDLCMMFGGGGHPRAAGCSIHLPLEEAKEKILLEAKKHLK
ncbi:MAG: bifunctional oligoribonuclease/PAP phosphatase NrnA [Clostridia bacterium]|nr:bifunctional oligoribonuclease/PAP phosphatase NrnA [Clostridia bacterium]